SRCAPRRPRKGGGSVDPWRQSPNPEHLTGRQGRSGGTTLPAMQRLGGLDAAFLYFETPTMHMHVGGLMLIDFSEAKEPYSYARMRAYIEAREGLVPAFRQKLATVPLNLSRPYWIQDADFDLDYHLRRITVPSPGGDRETAEVVADILSRPLDRSRPLWEMWIVEGRKDGLIGVVSKLHHSTIDGVSGANMMAELF